MEHKKKICRGPEPPANNQYAWGTSNVIAGTTFSGPENGTEVFNAPTYANCTANNTTFSGGDGGQGPTRVGIHARAYPSRIANGVAYYGPLDMSGNVWEQVVMVAGPDGTASSSPTYDGSWGDGMLDWTTHQANVSTWPLGNPCARDLRGGSWANDPHHQRISARFWCYPGHSLRDPSTRQNTWGGRGAR